MWDIDPVSNKPDHQQSDAPLSGVRIIDLTTVVFGPYGTQILADLGADVIKIEPPEGDILRGVEPSCTPGMGALFMATNRNKRSVMLDLKTEPARKALISVLATADVFIHSMRPKALARLQLTAEDLKKHNPDLIHVSALGFGSGGPYSGKPAYDDIVQSVSGFANLAQLRDDNAPPDYAPTIIADKLGGVTTVYAVLAALFQRERTGTVNHVEVPMFETLVSFLLVEHFAAATFEEIPESFGYNRMLVPHRRPLRTLDGYITILPYSTRQWQAFFKATGRDDMLENTLVTDRAERSSNIGALYEMVGELTPTRTTSDWLALMEKIDVPAAPVQSLKDLPNDPHLKATNFFVEIDQPDGSKYWAASPPVTFSKSSHDITRGHVPKLGEHGHEVLREAGLDREEVEAALTSRTPKSEQK